MTLSKERWIEFRAKDTNALIGISCKTCSANEIKEQVAAYEETLKKAITTKKVVEINTFSPDPHMIETSFQKDELIDPRNIFFQPFYFQGRPEAPGGFHIGAFPKAISIGQKKVTTALKMESKPADSLQSPLYKADNIVFLPRFATDASTGEVSYESLSNITEKTYKPIAVIDGLPAYRITGEAGRIFAYHHIFVMHARVVSKALTLKKKITFHRNRRHMLSFVMSVSDIPWDEEKK